MTNWDANAPKVDKMKDPSWATWIPGRSPELKVQPLGMAKSALGDTHHHTGRCRGGYLYRFINGSWRVILRVKPDSHPDEYAIFKDWKNFRLNPPEFEFTIVEWPGGH